MFNINGTISVTAAKNIMPKMMKPVMFTFLTLASISFQYRGRTRDNTKSTEYHEIMSAVPG